MNKDKSLYKDILKVKKIGGT